MDVAKVKLTLMERLMLVWDESALLRIGKAIETEIHEDVGEGDFTGEEIAELDRRRAEYLRGEGTSYTVEESLERLRSRK